MDLLDILRADYERFPAEQTYGIYAPGVYFKDPLTEFRGLERYRRMIGFMGRWFKDLRLELHGIERTDSRIVTRWTLSWRAPLPWQPRIRIDGWSELIVDETERIVSHIDYWRHPPLDVLRQHFAWGSSR
ncbi:DUF2358 domain-containing protein [Gloeobacter kilaueensis]|uniref:SnoaL-like domain-containing protein n=1 Tax=Gloeobacter kilaueensis (strain ATCC BAA-2537 / CCAP 1431/1 / ULC 316 / JS1) TaxID=1183438 RepID=U5QPP3_GLOK1|nr:DUF2358 domain-containing protein [Gloeobacter kilaueensis]AGY59594.1 hypothetical protein GKIL_3348 [Gloeobacter kilaueensis JS1]